MCPGFAQKIHLLSCSPLRNQICYSGASSWSRVSFGNLLGLLSVRSRSQWGLVYIYNQYMTVSYTFWTPEFLGTKPSLMVDHHTPRCQVKIQYSCVWGQGYSRHLKFELIRKIWNTGSFVAKLGVVIHSSYTGVLCKKSELLCSRSRSLWW